MLLVSNEIFEIIGPAFIVGLMIALTHAPLGVEVLKRGIIFIDLAVAQIAGLGLVVVKALIHEPSAILVQLVTLIFALAAGLFFYKVENKSPKQQEAIIGCSFILAASLAILFLSNHPHGGQEIQHLLSGQMLFVSWLDVASHAPVYLAILVIWFLRPQHRQGIGFYILFAIAITSSVQLVGVYVVFASLILPALAAFKLRNPHKTAWSCGTLSVILGIIAAIIFDLPSGPVIVISYILTASIISFYRKKRNKIAT